jgi:hypothetical protein
MWLKKNCFDEYGPEVQRRASYRLNKAIGILPIFSITNITLLKQRTAFKF